MLQTLDREMTEKAVAQERAQTADLVYVSDAEPGIRRKGTKRFAYYAPGGAQIRDEATLARIRALAIPPAWTDVWISPDADGHIQATGRDLRGRKQYRYHERWRATRDATKFDHILEFAQNLPALREQRAAGAD